MKHGDIVRIGNQTLMCGDAGYPKDVKRLLKGVVPDLVFTSPPYLSQRKYTKDIPCWDTMMRNVFMAISHHATTQLLVNLGIVHEKGEWVPYYNPWVEWMRTQGWRRFGLAFWDKLNAVPGDHHGRLAPCAEIIFHFNKLPRSPNKTVICKTRGHIRQRNIFRRNSDSSMDTRDKVVTTGTHKILDNVLRITPELSIRGKHPAMFPVALPLAIHSAYSNSGDIVCDPFVGSGTSLVAAEMGGRRGYGIDISEEYCTIAEERLRKHVEKPKQEVQL